MGMRPTEWWPWSPAVWLRSTSPRKVLPSEPWTWPPLFVGLSSSNSSPGRGWYRVSWHRRRCTHPGVGPQRPRSAAFAPGAPWILPPVLTEIPSAGDVSPSPDYRYGARSVHQTQDRRWTSVPPGTGRTEQSTCARGASRREIGPRPADAGEHHRASLGQSVAGVGTPRGGAHVADRVRRQCASPARSTSSLRGFRHALRGPEGGATSNWGRPTRDGRRGRRTVPVARLPGAVSSCPPDQHEGSPRQSSSCGMAHPELRLARDG